MTAEDENTSILWAGGGHDGLVEDGAVLATFDSRVSPKMKLNAIAAFDMALADGPHRNAAVWFDARTGNGSSQVNPFPRTPANGFDNPFLVTTGAAAEGVPWTTIPIAGNTDDAPPFFKAHT